MLWPTIIITTALALALLAWLDISRSTRGEVERLTVCPHTGRSEQVVFEEDFFDALHYEDVVSCSAFGPTGKPVTCDRACLQYTRSQVR